MKSVIKIVAIAMVLACVPKVSAQEVQIIEEVIVSINDDIITLSEFDKKFDTVAARIRAQLQGEELESELLAMRRDLFNMLINQRLLKQQAQHYGWTLPESSFNQWKENIKQQIDVRTDRELELALSEQGMTLDDLREVAEMNFIVPRILQVEIGQNLFSSESKKQEYYEEHLTRYSTPEKVHIAQIVLPFSELTRDQVMVQAEQIVGRVRGGEDFGTIYREVVPNASPDADGDIGTLETTTLREDMRVALDGLKGGDVSDPIETANAAIIVYLKDKEERRVIPLEEINDQVMEDMRREAMQSGIAKVIAKYKGLTRIDIRSEQFKPLYDKNSNNIGL